MSEIRLRDARHLGRPGFWYGLSALTGFVVIAYAFMTYYQHPVESAGSALLFALLIPIPLHSLSRRFREVSA